ncbi:MAG: hypothetical protein ABIZ80_23920 [Bryobacteraceae bacterium]
MKQVLSISNDEHLQGERARLLMAHVPYEIVYFERDRSLSHWESMRQIWMLLRQRRWDLVYVEGTGVPARGCP